MLNKKRGSKLFLWIPVLTLAILPLAGIARADVSGTVTVPHSKGQAMGIKVAVVAASDTSGNEDVALRALQAANIGLSRQSGYEVESPEAVAKALKSASIQWPFAPRQYPDIRKKLDNVDRVLSITVTPQNSQNPTYDAVAELYDTTTGGLVNRGESLYTVSSNTNKTDSQMRAVDGAVLGAIADMSRPASLNGIVISRPEGYIVRISLGSTSGLRNGSRLEYLDDGHTIAYGTVIDLGTGESIATVAPESAYSKVQVNTPFRTADIPSAGLMGPSYKQISKKEFADFSRDFAISSVLATITYLIVR